MRRALRRRRTSTGCPGLLAARNCSRVIPSPFNHGAGSSSRCGALWKAPSSSPSHGDRTGARAPEGDGRPMPFPLPDPAELRALAGRIDAHARAARARADRLGSQVAAASWHGLAASTFDRQVDVTLGALRGAARRLDDAADALRRHADNISRVIDTLVAIVRLGIG